MDPSKPAIVVVEDDRDLRESLVMALETEGYAVRSATNGNHALETLREIGQPCVVFLDLMMPECNGWEFLEKLEREPPGHEPHRIILSSAAGDARALAKEKGLPLLKKPVDLDELLNTAEHHFRAISSLGRGI